MDKTPIAGSKVYLLSHHGDNEFQGADEPLAVTHTDAEGRYQFQNINLPTIQSGQPNSPFDRFGTFQVCCEVEGFGIAWHGCRDYYPTPRPADFPKDVQDTGYHQGEAIEMDLTMRPVRSLTGRVIDDRGQAVQDATIQLRDLDYLDSEGHEYDRNHRDFCVLRLSPSTLFQAQSGTDGSFEIKGLPEGTVARVMIEHPHFAEQWLLAAITNTPLTENRYIANATVTTSDDGEKEVHVPLWETRPVRTTPLEIVVRATRRVLVDVIHEDDGTPAESVSGSAATAGGGFEAISSGKTDQDGRAVIKLPPGRYTLYLHPIQVSDDLPTKQDIFVDDQPGEQTFKVALKKGCRLTLEVVDADTGKGIPGVAFMKVAANGMRRGTGFSTNDSGECRAIVEPGIHHYGIEMAEWYPNIDPFQKKAVVCEAGKTARLQFRLRK